MNHKGELNVFGTSNVASFPGVGLSLPGWRQVVPTHARARRLEQMVSWGRGMLVVSDTFSDSLLLTHSLAYTRTNVGWGREQERVPGDR